MALEDRLTFRQALLEHRTEDEWREYRLDHLQFYRKRVPFEGREVNYGDLIKEYAQRFPADKDYSTRGHLNRMLADCEVPQFSFTDPEVIRGFLLSAKSQAEWNKYQPSYHTFDKMDFQYHGIPLKGQMLLHHVFVGLDNQENGTYYAVLDYQERPELKTRLNQDRSARFVTGLFERGGIKVKSKLIQEEDLTLERLREILLARRTEDEWRLWRGKREDFWSTWFELEGYKNFTGASLRRRFEEVQGKKYSVKELFTKAEIEVGDPEFVRKSLEDRFERFYGVFDNPTAMRNLFLGIKSEEEWAKPQQYSPLRKQKVSIDGDRSVSIHTLLHLFSIYRYNSEQETIDAYIGFNEVQSEEHKGLIQSNKKALGELLDFAGLEYRFIPDISEVDLHDPTVLRRMLFHATLEGRDLSPTELKSAGIQQFRKARFKDPTTGVDIAGQSLMIYYSALHYVKEHPEVGLDDAANKLHQGKSNLAVMAEILEKARF